jgi:hypothetical protein
VSWYIKKIGKRESVRNEISADENLPPAIKDAIASVLQDEHGAPSGVRIEGHGHTYIGPGSANSSIKLEVEPFQFTE